MTSRLFGIMAKGDCWPCYNNNLTSQQFRIISMATTIKKEEPNRLTNPPLYQQMPFTITKVERRKKEPKFVRRRNSLWCNSGRWTIEEDLIYRNFLALNKEKFETEFKRRSHRVFEKLSKMLKSKREPEQCRSHHQKMQVKTKYGSLDTIVEYLDRKILKRKRKQGKNIEFIKAEEDPKTVFSKNFENYKLECKPGMGELQVCISFSIEEIPEWN